MVLPVTFKGTIIDVIQKLTSETDTSRTRPEVLQELYDFDNFSEFAFALTIGMISGTLNSMYAIQYGKQMSTEDLTEMNQIVSDNTRKLREYYDVGHLK